LPTSTDKVMMLNGQVSGHEKKKWVVSFLSPVTVTDPAAATAWLQAQTGNPWPYNFGVNNCAHYSCQGLNAGKRVSTSLGHFRQASLSTHHDLDGRSSLPSSNQVTMRKTMLTSLIFLNWLFIHSCNMINSGDPLPGKIVVSNSQKHEYFIYVDSDIPNHLLN